MLRQIASIVAGASAATFAFAGLSPEEERFVLGAQANFWSHIDRERKYFANG